jgi:outer membrane protein assembly factor BamA
VIPKFITRWKTEFGLAVVGFLDIGFASDGLSSLLDQSPMLGTGAGVRINWPWVGMFRLDYGLGYYGGEHIDSYLNFAVGQKF